MTKEQATHITGLKFHYPPDHVNTTETAKGVREQWVFTDINGMPLWYLYFENGVLTSIQG